MWLGVDLHIFILLDVFEGLFEGEYHRGTILALSSAPDARILVSFLLLGHVHHYISVLGVLPDHLTGVDYLPAGI